MSTFTVPVVTVKSVTKHPNADALDIIEFEEIAWRCVERRGIREPGELVVYVPIDSVVDTKRPEFSFLVKSAKKDGTARIRTIRLRGEISQGLILDCPEKIDSNDGILGVNPFKAKAGMDAAFHFNIKKYEPPPETVGPMMAGTYPSWCEKSDAERYQNFNRTIELVKDDTFVQTLKLDGTSITVFYDADRVDNPIGVCSRNWEVKEFDEGPNKWVEQQDRPKATNIYWQAVRKYNLLDKVKELAGRMSVRRVALQGELCGPGIQDNKLGLTELTFFAFDIYNGDINEFENYYWFLKHCEGLEITTVPVLHMGKDLNEEINTNFEFVKQLTYLNDTPAEGVVFVAVPPKRIGTLGRVKFKYINPEFLLRYE